MRDNLSIIKESYSAGANGDMQGLLADFAETGYWIEMAGGPYAGTYLGKEAVLENVHKRINKDWNPFSCMPEEFHDVGNIIIVTGYYLGVHAITKKNLKVRFAHLWKLEDECIIGFEQFVDTKLMRDAMVLDQN